VLGRDVDPEVVGILKDAGYPDVGLDNSLANVNRAKYGLENDDRLVVVGNPPYNDVTSLNKKRGSNSKESLNITMDDAVRSNDLGIAFLKAFDVLEADVVCVLHPLSYLIKESNFKSKIAPFVKNYRLERGVFFSSAEFSDTGHAVPDRYRALSQDSRRDGLRRHSRLPFRDPRRAGDARPEPC
jgi:hypothetical protein